MNKSALMTSATKRLAAMVVIPAVAVGLALAASGRAHGNPVLTVTNGDFHLYTGTTPGTDGDYFQNVNPTGWTGGGGLIFVTNAAGINSGIYLPVYGPTAGVPASPSNPFPAPPPGGNFVEADGNPIYENSFSYQLSGLTPGTTYSLSFFQAAGQQTPPFTGATTNQWIVGLGVTGSFFSTNDIGGGFDSYTYSDPSGSVVASPLMNVVSQGFHPWEEVTVNLTADDPNDVLTFLAWGDNGNTANLPPIAFLDIAGNGALVPVPEASGLLLWGIGMAGFAAFKWRRRAQVR
jgi:hypothetical protein